MPAGEALNIQEFAEVGRHLPGKGGMFIDMRLHAQSVQDDDHDMNCKACSNTSSSCATMSSRSSTCVEAVSKYCHQGRAHKKHDGNWDRKRNAARV